MSTRPTPDPAEPDAVAGWIEQAIERQTRLFSKRELLTAIRALSARYVERRGEMTRRAATDSAGKRAAFAAFYAPLHLLTAREVARALGLDSRRVETLVDLGCGTGVASAGWALTSATPPGIRGVDRQGWAADEARWTWRTLGLRGRVERGEMTTAAAELLAARPRRPTAVVLGWSANELPGDQSDVLRTTLLALARSGTPTLVLEPLARAATPWWDDWVETFIPGGGRADVWKFDVPLPPALADLDEAAGFQRETLGVRTIWTGG